MRNIKLFLMNLFLILGILVSPLKVFAQVDSSFANIDYTRGSEIRVILEGRQLEFSLAPQLINGRVLVPMRKIFESFGLDVSWDAQNQAAKGKSPTMDITIPIGSKKAEINGISSPLDVPAQIISGNTMVPLRFLSEHMGYNIVWNNSSQLILLSKDNIVEWRYEGFESVKPYKEYEVKYINGVNTKEVRYTGKTHDVSFVNLYRKDGSLIQNVPDFKISEYVADWSQKSDFANQTYWVHIDKLEEILQVNPAYLEDNLQQLDLGRIKQTAEVGNYIKLEIKDHYFNLESWKKTIGTRGSDLNTIRDSSILDEKLIYYYDTMFKVRINDQFETTIPFNTINKAVFTKDSNKIYTVLEKSPSSLFNWDSNTWKRLEGDIPWTGMTQDMLLVQLKENPDQTSKLTTKFNKLSLWVYTRDYGDSIYYFKDGVLMNIL